MPIANQVPLAPVEVPTDSRQDASQGKEVEALQGKDKSKDKGKGKGKASDTTISQSEQAADPRAPKTQAYDISFCSIFIFFVYCFCIFFLLRKCTTLLLLMKICPFYFISLDK